MDIPRFIELLFQILHHRFERFLCIFGLGETLSIYKVDLNLKLLDQITKVSDLFLFYMQHFVRIEVHPVEAGIATDAVTLKV